MDTVPMPMMQAMKGLTRYVSRGCYSMGKMMMMMRCEIPSRVEKKRKLKKSKVWLI